MRRHRYGGVSLKPPGKKHNGRRAKKKKIGIGTKTPISTDVERGVHDCSIRSTDDRAAIFPPPPPIYPITPLARRHTAGEIGPLWHSGLGLERVVLPERG